MKKERSNIEKTEQYYWERTLEGYRKVALRKSQRQLQWSWDRAIARLPESKMAFDPVSNTVSFCSPADPTEKRKKK